jgi:hypothetical protein
LRGARRIVGSAARWATIVALIGRFAAPPAVAENHGAGNQGWDQRLYYSSDFHVPTNPILGRSREYGGVPVGGWMVFASVLTGVVWDDNVFQTSQFATRDWGARLRPSLELVRNNGIHKTTVYGFADARLYGKQEDANVVNGSIGAGHVWEAQRDLVFKADFEYARRTDINNAGTLLTPGGPVTIVTPLDYGLLTGSLSAQKSFGPIFVGFGGVVSHTNFDDLTDVLGQNFDQDYRDQTIYTLSSRIGVRVGPVIYSFVEPSLNWRRFRDSTFDSSGQRIIAGVGSDRVSLFRGEVFAGYQRQDYDDANIATVHGSVFGGRLFWYPTRDLVVSFDADRKLADSTLSTPGNQFGSPVESTSLLFKAAYVATDTWSLSARFGYSLIDYKNTAREDSQCVAGAAISYFIRRNLAVTFEWQHINLQSNVDGNSFERNVLTLGTTYRY